MKLQQLIDQLHNLMDIHNIFGNIEHFEYYIRKFSYSTLETCHF